ncbi:MAG: TonB-dependent receptor, partial [Muribaculaceae bacterium]|nr:TonB-dependent receptor [Muribaculaceae bacterium]
MERIKFFLAICGLTLPFIGLADTFHGRVVDETGSPLIGATVKASNDRITTTNTEGEFSISVEGSTAKLQVSYIGFLTETFILKSNTGKHELRLTPDIGALEEVVVTATRTPKALKDVPVVTRLITADDIRKSDATNIQDLLTEELPGLEFTYTMSQETSLNMSGS